MELTEVKDQQDCVNSGQISLRPSGELTTPCSRTPLAGKLSETSDNVKKCDRIKMLKINITRNMKATTSPSSVLSPLLSSSTSPTTRFHKAISASDFPTPSRDSC